MQYIDCRSLASPDTQIRFPISQKPYLGITMKLLRESISIFARELGACLIGISL